MLYHVSLNARDTDRVATVLAEIVGGTVVASPSPPFDPASRFVCLWDERGTMLEIGPWGMTWQPGPDGASEPTPAATMPAANYFHALFLARLPVDEILAIAEREGWRAALVDNGPFRVVNLWVENFQLLEFTTPELLPDYLATFGAANREQLDGELRALEQAIAAGADVSVA